jgi:hypothetical protein
MTCKNVLVTGMSEEVWSGHADFVVHRGMIRGVDSQAWVPQLIGLLVHVRWR